MDHHDKAYSWAERRKIEIHPKTGAAQLVEIRESVREITIPHYVHEEKVRKPLSGLTKEELLKYGIPEEWIDDLIDAGEERLLEIAEHLPGEASEAVLNLAIGVIIRSEGQINRAAFALCGLYPCP